MRSKIILTAFIMVVTALGIYTIILTFSLTDEDILEQVLNDSKNSNISEQPTIDNSTITVPQADYKEYLEIEVNAEDITKADSSHIIGLTEPFNSDYITKQDVINSINKIGDKDIVFSGISKKYQNEFLTLRHVEMIEGVREKDSKVRSALKEYVEKIKPIELENGTFDGEKEEEEKGIIQQTNPVDPNNLNYKADVSIAETEQLLQGGN